MATPASPSAALVRTARSEIERLGRTLNTIEQRRAALLGQLAELEKETEGYERRRQLLEELINIERHHTPSSAPALRPSVRVVKGGELRREAGRLLWLVQRESDIHYREWFERVLAAGYAVGGKDPLASFLTNMRDSPAVQRGSSQGRYRLDPGSIDRLGQEIREGSAELVDVEHSIERAYESGADQRSIEDLREHRDNLTQRIKRLESKLQEVLYIFDDPAEVAPPTAHRLQAA